jgi:hypothetical protein
VSGRSETGRALPLLLAATTLLFAPIVYKAVLLSRGTDYPAHLKFAAQMLADRQLVTPHFLYQLEVLLLRGLGIGSVADLKPAGAVASVINLNLLATALFFRLRWRLAGPPRGGTAVAPAGFDWTCVLGSLSLMLVTPIPLLYGVDHLKYLGYIGLTVYHNPTMLVLKPLAVLLSWYAVGPLVEDGGRRVDWRRVLVLALLVVGCALAKPSYLIAFLPGAVVFAVVRRLRGASPNLALLALGIVLPAVAVLGWQYWMYYPHSRATLVFAPLAAKLHHSSWLLPKLGLSVLFPAAVYLSFPSEARRDARLNLAWLVFAFGASYAYLFGEEGRIGSSNFDWSAQAGLFIVFVESLVFLAERQAGAGGPGAPRGRLALCWCLYGLHLASGIWYAAHILWKSPPGRFVYI